MSVPPFRLALSRFQVAVLIGIGILLLLGFGYAGRLIASSEAQAQVAEWEEDVRLAEQDVRESEAQLEYVQSDAYVIEQARSQFGWTFRDEVGVRVEGDESSPAVAVAATPVPVDSWRLWLERFFGP